MVNRSVTWADWDEELLAIELRELSAEGYSLDLTGFDQRELDALLASPDEERADVAPPAPENPITRAGDLWVCGAHRVLCGDATRAEDVARLLGDRDGFCWLRTLPMESSWIRNGATGPV